ncbi:DUF5994 family protein [Prescottella equi]|uniref:DUF5994 family protein n=1 Tax=Rhodococcus hoagii TaxID=43767 RepID=UPI000A0FF0BA|nr:DUF5994 family protein [Prescottella equi]ORL34966.1 hypothetical protein A6I91_01805 [Prescottella equi]
MYEVETADGVQPFPIPTRTPRLVLCAPGPGTGQMGGAWWPWTQNLTAQLHDLVAVLTPRTGAIERIAFDWNAISVGQRRIDGTDGIRFIGPLPGQPAGVMCLIGTDHRGTFLAVIPPTTQPQRAYEDMRAIVEEGYRLS